MAETMDARDLAAVRQIKAAVEFLAEQYGPMVISICQIEQVDSATAQAMAEQVIAEAAMKLNLNDYKDTDLSVPLGKAAREIAKAKRASMVRNLWKTDQESQELTGKTVEEREDFALVRFRKRTNFTWKQIAEIMGMTEGQARVRYHRALLNRPELKNVR
jgi:hypothetical protein